MSEKDSESSMNEQEARTENVGFELFALGFSVTVVFTFLSGSILSLVTHI